MLKWLLINIFDIFTYFLYKWNAKSIAHVHCALNKKYDGVVDRLVCESKGQRIANLSLDGTDIFSTHNNLYLINTLFVRWVSHIDRVIRQSYNGFPENVWKPCLYEINKCDKNVVSISKRK